MELKVLGPLTVVGHGVDVVVPPRRQQLVLARLVVELGRVVPAERLMEEVWGTAAARRGTGPLRTIVWELRRLLHTAETAAGGGHDRNAGAVLVAQPRGYLLDVDRSQVDSTRFEDLLAEARTVGPTAADRGLATLDDALRLWRGPAFGDLAGEAPLQPEAMRLDALLLEARELRSEVLLDLGRHLQVAAELAVLARAHPERERLWALLMIALYRSARQSEALRCYQEARTTLVDAVGVEPGPELRQLELAILRHDPVLQWSTRWDGGDGQGLPKGNSDPVGRALPSRPAPPTEGPAAGVHGAPRPMGVLVGRSLERRVVAEALDRSRLVTVVGVGGCGKTRLATAVADDVAPRFPGGVWFVDLATASTTDRLATVVAAALGEERGLLTPDPSAVPPDRAYGADRTGGEVLLVLDNCEHLVEAVAQYVSQLMVQSPTLRVLATSREALCVEAEIVWRLQGLGLPEPGGQGAFMGSEAVELFVRRGAASLPGFAPRGKTLDLVGRVCQRLDGLPLAIELVAALVGTLPVGEIAQRLDRRLGGLATWRRHHLGRHRTLRAALDWSFDLLDPPLQELFTQLGVFVGPFDLAAVEAVVGDRAGGAAAEGLARLVQTSLVEPVGGHDGVEHYRLLETVRHYAADRLERRYDHGEICRRHGHHFAGLAADAERHLREPGPASADWTGCLDAGLPNLRAALRWAMVHEAEVALGLLSSLRWFLPHLALLDDLAAWLDTQLAHRSALSCDLELRLLTTRSTVALYVDEPARVRQFSTEAAALARRLDEPRQLAPALVGCAASALAAHEHGEARQHLQEAHALCTRLGDRWGVAWTLVGSALLSYQVDGGDDAARRQLDGALDHLRELRDLRSFVFPLGLRALQALRDDDVDLARDLASEATDIVSSLDDGRLQPFTSGVLGLVELVALRLGAARDLLLRSVRHFQASNVDLVLWACIDGLAVLAAAGGRHDGAVTLLGAAARVGRPAPPTLPSQCARTLDGLLSVAQSKLGPGEVERYLRRGQDMSIADVFVLAEAATAFPGVGVTDEIGRGRHRLGPLYGPEGWASKRGT